MSESLSAVFTAQRFSLILEAAPDAILEVDENGKIVRANSEADHMFQRCGDVLLGLPIAVDRSRRDVQNLCSFLLT